MNDHVNIYLVSITFAALMVFQQFLNGKLTVQKRSESGRLTGRALVSVANFPTPEGTASNKAGCTIIAVLPLDINPIIVLQPLKISEIKRLNKQGYITA